MLWIFFFTVYIIIYITPNLIEQGTKKLTSLCVVAKKVTREGLTDLRLVRSELEVHNPI